MPEEQFLDLATTDARTDIYSLGKILYQAIQGKMTQERNKPFETVHLYSLSTRILIRLDKVIRSATAKDRKLRISSVKVLPEELEDIIQESAYAKTVSKVKLLWSWIYRKSCYTALDFFINCFSWLLLKLNLTQTISPKILIVKSVAEQNLF